MFVWLCVWALLYCFFFFFKQKTAYEMRISDWSSDVCSSDLASITLAKMIIDRAPRWDGGGMSKVYFGLSGSDANETNIKLIWYRSEESRVGRECVSTV